MSVPEKPVNEK